MIKEIDFPPVWLAGFAAAGGIIGRLVPIATPLNDPLGAVLVAAGLLLMVAAALQMLIARTSVIPRRDPAAFVHGGLYRFSRNPIYLADAVVLVGLLIAWDALIALPLVAVFVIVIQRRFILDEESRLSRRFGDEYLDYTQRVAALALTPAPGGDRHDYDVAAMPRSRVTSLRQRIGRAGPVRRPGKATPEGERQ